MNEIEQNCDSSTDEDDVEEILHFTRVLNSYRAYRKDALTQISRSENNFRLLPKEHQDLLPEHLSILEKMRGCIEQNQAICMEIVKTSGMAFENKKYEESDENDKATQPRPMDLDKVRTTLKQIVRDWSLEGESERRQSYRPIIEEICSRLPLDSDKARSKPPTVLVPGCGLGRLAWELARRGYSCEGNEFSFFMLFASNFILNRTQHSNLIDFHQFTIHPWVTQQCNVPSWDSVLLPVKFPDVNPAVIPPTARFSMAAGDFLEVYEKKGSWSCIATCYFIDTAHNIIAYIERIYHLLVPGGLWVNLGPLLYHYAGMPDEASVEFSYDQVISVVQKVGFHILKDDRNHDSSYVNNPSSMLQYNYKCGFLVAFKPEVVTVS